MLRRTFPSRVFNTTTVGSTIGAFKCLRFEPSLSDLADPEGNPLQGTLWVHEKTQTQVFFFSAKEATSSSSSGSSTTTTTTSAAGEKACSISFCTPPENDSGATHILEHTVLCGSEKFPEVRDPFFKMLRRSLSTFMNAMTSPDSTFFPFSTVNEQDFFNILDVYLDCTLHPLIRPLDFAQEAHRLKVLSSSNNNDDDSIEKGSSSSSSNKLERTGVVLNEMKGALSDPMTWFQTCLFNHCHAGSAYSRCFGGAPPAIPDLKHEDLIRYYGRHYQRPVVAIYDSAITSADAKKQFLETSLKKILTEVEKPRLVLQQQQQSGDESTQDAQASSASPLEMLANLRQTKFQDLSADNTTTSTTSDSTTSTNMPLSSIMNRKYAFSWGPPDPVASSLEEQNLSTARIGFFLPLENIISNKNIASRDDHKEMFKLQLALHILLRPPSGPLYKALLLNPQNVKAMQSENIQDVMKRTSQLSEQSKTGKFDDDGNSATESQQAEEQEQQQQESSTIDLIPGSGFDHSAQVPALFIGLQNVPTTIASETDCSTMCLAKSELLAAIIQSCLSEHSLHGINQDLVESAVHEFELALRVRDKMSAVNSTINSTSAVMRGLDPFYTHSATDIDKEISSDLLKSTTTTTIDKDVANTTTNNVYFTRLIKEQILNSELFEVNQRLTAVVGSSKFVQQQSAEEKKNLEELSSQISKEEVEKAKKLDEDLLQAQKKTDDGGSLPTLTVVDISPSPINFTNPSFEDKHIQTYVTNTAGLVYCRFMFPIPEEFCVGNDNLENLNNNNSVLLLPLFSTLFSQLGHLNKSISEQDIAVRKVCSGFEAAVNIVSLPTSDSSSVRPNLRAVQVSFHCMPENLEKSLQLLQECIESNCNGLWTEKIANDPERKAMLFQLITMIAGGMESQITQAGTQYATCEALKAGLASSSSSSTASSSTLNSYATWSGMSLVRQVSQIKEKITELSSSGKDPSEAVSFLFPAFENLARSLFSFNPNTFSYVICGPQDQEKVKQTISEKFLSSVPNLLSSTPSDSSALINQKRLIINDDPSLHAIMMRKNGDDAEKTSSLQRDITRIDLPNSDGSSFVGCVLPTTLSLRHELSPAFRLALQIASQEFLHREIREIGGAYGSMARLGLGQLAGVSGIATFGSYRDPSPKRTIEILRDGAIYDWFKQNSGANGLLDKRMLQEAKLSIFGSIDAPMVPHEVAERYAVCKYDYETFATYRKRLLDASLDDVVRSVEEHLKPEDTKKMMSVCVLGGPKEDEK